MSSWLKDEIINMPESEIVEENIYIDETLLKNKSLIRVDMNTIQYPLFSKNPKRKINQIVKYFFNSKRDTYINIIPMNGNYIPGEMEEKIFIALMKLMKKKGMQRRFVVTASELKNELKMNTKDYMKRVKDSLIRLALTNYQFKNTLYSNKEKSLLTKEVHTTIMSLEVLKLEDSKNENLKNQILDKRIKEVYEISISDYFYDNLVSKGYLVYDSDLLLTIDNSISRTIYMLIEKLRFDKCHLRIDILFLIKRIPLKYDKKNIARTIKIINKSLEELKKKKLIEKYNFIKDSTWEKSEIDIFFSEINLFLKQERFYCDLNDFKRMSTIFSISDMQHEPISNREEDINMEIINNIITNLPPSLKKLKTMHKAIKDSIENYGIEKVQMAIQYLKKQKNLKNPRAYFLKSLENEWFDIDALKINNSNSKKPSVNNISKEINKENKLYFQFEKRSKSFQKKIEDLVYREYIKLCGMETKIQQLAFIGSRKRLINDYLDQNPDVLNKENYKQEGEDVIIEYTELRSYIDEFINLYKNSIKIEFAIEDVRKKIILDSMPYFLNKTLTKEELEEIIKNILQTSN
ncbi:hypothetical protein [Cetobacterium sp.]|uniref:hypothetical protein n=1 Tax=Cetobacterium sp. TaxID=2071632 RepID=UPI003F2AA571